MWRRKWWQIIHPQTQLRTLPKTNMFKMDIWYTCDKKILEDSWRLLRKLGQAQISWEIQSAWEFQAKWTRASCFCYCCKLHMQLPECRAVKSWLLLWFFNTNLSTILIDTGEGFKQAMWVSRKYAYLCGFFWFPSFPNPSLWLLKTYCTEFLLTFFEVGIFSRTTNHKEVKLLARICNSWKYLYIPAVYWLPAAVREMEIEPNCIFVLLYLFYNFNRVWHLSKDLTTTNNIYTLTAYLGLAETLRLCCM